MLTLILIVGCCGAALGADSTTAPPPATSTVAPTAAPTAAPTTTGAAADTTTGMHVPASTAAAAPGTTAGMAALAAAATAAAPVAKDVVTPPPAAAAAAAAPAPAPAPPATSLVTLYSFKNNQYNTHAYCSTDDCIATVKGRGFKSDKLPRGKIVAPTDAAKAAAEKACPGVKFLPLGFPKKRQGYVHNLDGAGVQAGYVVTTAGACNATIGLKHYKSNTSDDIWYTAGQSKQSMQNGGKPVFYLWE